MTLVHLLVTPDFEADDLPPKGYLQWHEWAEVQHKAGIKQVECPSCASWKTPQELSPHEIRWALTTSKGKKKDYSAFECRGCCATAII